MSLKVYTSKSQIPSNIQFINYNDKFFNSVILSDTATTAQILKTIDKAEFNTETTFIGRDKSLGALNKSLLSTGCKTLLNIISNPDRCFDVIGCGDNALELLRFIREGHVYWKNPVLHFVGTSDCDIETDGKRFTNFNKFLSYVMDEV